MKHTLGEGLRQISDRAIMLRYLLDCAALSDETPRPEVFSGLADLMAPIATGATQARQALPVKAQDMELREDED